MNLGSSDLPNNLVDFVASVVSDMLKYHKVYSGKVMNRYVSGSNRGVIDVYAGEFCGINEFDESSWLSCKPAINSGNSIIPDRTNYVYFTFKSGKPDEPIYFGQAYDYYKYINSGEKRVVFEYSSFSGDSFILFDESVNKFIIKSGSTSTEKSILGETLKTKLEDLITAIRNITVMTPTGMSGTVDSVSSNKIALDLIENTLDNILSNNLENN